LWFTEENANKIGQISTSGIFAELVVPTPASHPTAISAAPALSGSGAGGMWFVEVAGNKVGRATVMGAVPEVPLPSANAQPAGITNASDGNRWLTEPGVNKIARLASSVFTYTEFSIPTPNSGASGISGGPDAAVWFTETNANKIGRLPTASEPAP